MKLPRPLPLKSLDKRLWLSLTSLVKLLYFRPAYFFLAAGVSILFYEFIFWFLNLGLLQYLLTSPFLTVGDKIQMLIGSYSGIFTLPLSPLALTLFAVSVFLYNKTSFETFSQGEAVVRTRTEGDSTKLTYKRAINTAGDSVEHEVALSPSRRCTQY